MLRTILAFITALNCNIKIIELECLSFCSHRKCFAALRFSCLGYYNERISNAFVKRDK